jgi:hypothetical protein
MIKSEMKLKIIIKKMYAGIHYVKITRLVTIDIDSMETPMQIIL